MVQNIKVFKIMKKVKIVYSDSLIFKIADKNNKINPLKLLYFCHIGANIINI